MIKYQDKSFIGIITDCDIRKYLSKNKCFNIEEAKAKDLMNTFPIVFQYNELNDLVSLFFLENRFSNFLIAYKESIFLLPAGSVLRNII